MKLSLAEKTIVNYWLWNNCGWINCETIDNKIIIDGYINCKTINLEINADEWNNYKTNNHETNIDRKLIVKLLITNQPSIKQSFA